MVVSLSRTKPLAYCTYVLCPQSRPSQAQVSGYLTQKWTDTRLPRKLMFWKEFIASSQDAPWW